MILAAENHALGNAGDGNVPCKGAIAEDGCCTEQESGRVNTSLSTGYQPIECASVIDVRGHRKGGWGLARP